MKYYRASELIDSVRLHGRCFLDRASDVLYFNWSCSTVEFIFSGTQLSAGLRAFCGQEFEGPPSPDAPSRPTWPWLAVFLDDQDTPARKFEITSADEAWLLWQSAAPETHRIRLVKLTENYKSYLGLTGLTMDGELLPVKPSDAGTLELIGDSITCGYGNLVLDPQRHFYSAEEDGWQSYGALAARALGLDWSCVSISGITGVRHADWMMPFAMEELYAFTDRPGQEKLGLPAESWDFAAHPKDYVVLNLGTNDCTAIQFSPDREELARFPADYIRFLREIRRLNGPGTQIICALGSMNYFLWHEIAEAVAQYRRKSGDGRVHLLRFSPMHPLDGAGADGHPSLETHRKMAAELAALLQTL